MFQKISGPTMAHLTCFLLLVISSLIEGSHHDHSQVDIDLSTGVVRGYSEQIRFILTPTQPLDRNAGIKGTAGGGAAVQGAAVRCSRRAIIRVDFENSRYKVARVVLKYGDSPRRWTFDASDSPAADGYGSVVSSSAPFGSSQSATAEIHVLNRQLRVYGRWPTPSHNLYAKSAHKAEVDIPTDVEDEESEEILNSDEAEVPEDPKADEDSSNASAADSAGVGHHEEDPEEEEDDDGEEEGKRQGAAADPSHPSNHHYHSHLSPLPGGSRMFMRVLDGTVKPNSSVELVLSSKGRSLWWRDDRLSHELPAPPGFLRHRRHGGSSFYLAFNRILGGEWRTGSGLCSISVQMMETEDQCPRSHKFCDKNAVCKPSRLGHQCSCKKGWQGDGNTCTDIDECRIKNGGCSHICRNEQGTHSCTCLPGFTKDPADPNNCIDVNECVNSNPNLWTEMHQCDHICKNTIGSYECECRKGYHLAADGKRCIAGASSCPPHLGCKYGCEVDFSSHVGTKVGIRCTCPRGYILEERDMKSCIPTCSIGNGGCQHHCHDVPMAAGPIKKGMILSNSKPVCTCQAKYLLGLDGKSCSASCSVQNGGCQKRCTTTSGGAVCSCPMGYVLNADGKTCTDIDECMIGNVTCEYGCVNSIGSFECLCPPGYRLNPADEITCLDMDECSIEKTCEQRCINTPGSYKCECKPGYQKFGISHCGDINECFIYNGGCSHNCINTDGSYYCSCNPGYQLHSNGKDCVGAE